jgi:hypothetical protein
MKRKSVNMATTVTTLDNVSGCKPMLDMKMMGRVQHWLYGLPTFSCTGSLLFNVRHESDGENWYEKKYNRN